LGALDIRSMLTSHLGQAERHVAQGKVIIGKQRSLVAELERDGHDTAEARGLLATFLDIQRLHEEDFARITRELRELSV
jgi:hypothetical protein